MEQHHRDAIARWVEHARRQPEHLAVVVAGSLTKGFGSADSDVDGLLVVTDEEFARRRATGELTFFSTECCDYPGGYVDAKYVPVGFLEAAEERGSEPARAAFVGALVPWSKVPGLEELVARIPVYPEAERTDKMLRFLAQLSAAQWYVGEGAKRADPYLSAWAAQRLVLFGWRLLLAYNRVLYPYHKWLMRTVAELPEKPDDVLSLADALLHEPTVATAEAFALSVLLFTEWPQPTAAWSATFIEDSEWNWLDHPPPIEDA